jgi:hypothetical protein
VSVSQEAAKQCETRLNEAGIAQAHDWMYALREVLYDIRRFNISLAKLFNTEDPAQEAPTLLQAIVNMALYEISPHMELHMRELEESLTSIVEEREPPSEQ